MSDAVLRDYDIDGVVDMVLVLRVAGEGYVLVDEERREQVLNRIRELWDTIFEEARWGSMDQAMRLYTKLIDLVDGAGRKVEKFKLGAEVVIPPRDLAADELQDLLGTCKR